MHAFQYLGAGNCCCSQMSSIAIVSICKMSNMKYLIHEESVMLSLTLGSLVHLYPQCFIKKVVEVLRTYYKNPILKWI